MLVDPYLPRLVSPPPDWQLITTPRWPERDRLIVPPQTRTLANNGWCSPSERALATPAVDPNEPLAIMDYLERAILVDRRCASRKMPVFDRKVAMGHRERLLECPLDAKGHAWAVNA